MKKLIKILSIITIFISIFSFRGIVLKVSANDTSSEELNDYTEDINEEN